MSDVGPGRHPSFDITSFEVDEQRTLRRLEQLFHLTWYGSLNIGKTSNYRYALIKPTRYVQSLLHTDREAMLVFSPYVEFQPRSLDAFDRILSESDDQFRIEKVVRILISSDPYVAKKIKSLFQSTPDSPVIVPFHTSELSSATTDEEIFQRFRDFTFARDFFSMSSPLRGDLYFYGRSDMINEISAKLASGENFGLFGLRRSGKTSIVNGVHRAIKKRGGVGIVIDCQSPTIHTRRWNELLFYIVSSLRNDLSISGNFRKESGYEERDAADSFLADMRLIKSRARVEFIAILFDEIERISFRTASSEHWNSQRDFLLFWQAVRSGFQSNQSPYTFLIVGTNPSAVEHNVILESDNPLFGNVEKRYIPMFDEEQLNEMIDDLGSFMGVSFKQHTKSRLFEDFGGHPFLSRYACSFICRKAIKRPLQVDRTLYEEGIAAFDVESAEYISHVVDMLKETYPDEYELLKMLAQDGSDTFSELADLDVRALGHIMGYGVIDKGIKSYYFRIGLLERFFSGQQKQSNLMSKQERRDEVSRRRNNLEERLRQKIDQVFQVVFPKNQRRDKVLRKLTENRRKELSNKTFDELLSDDCSPLYFNEVRQIIDGHWQKFENAFSINKTEFDYHMDVVNRHRNLDGHAGTITDEDFEKLRMSILELEKMVS